MSEGGGKATVEIAQRRYAAVAGLGPTPWLGFNRKRGWIWPEYAHDHAIFQEPQVVEEHLRTFVGKPPVTDPVVTNLFEKQNPQVPGMMSPK